MVNLSLSSNKGDTLTIICWIISLISLLCSLLSYIVLNFSNLKTIFLYQLFSILIFAEILNSLNQLSGIYLNYLSQFKQTKYYKFIRICYIQIYVHLFSIYLYLSTSVVIGIYSYRFLSKTQMLSKFDKYISLVKTVIIAFSLLFSYILWLIQMQKYQNELNVVKLYKRTNICSTHFLADIIGFGVCWVIIIICILVSIRSFYFLRKWTLNMQFDINKGGNELLELYNESDIVDSKKALKKVKIMKHRLVLLPVVSFIIFVMLSIHRSVYWINERGVIVEKPINNWFDYLFFWFPVAIKGIVFTVILFVNYKDSRKNLMKLILCK